MYYSIVAHPGQSDVNFNFNLTDIQQDQSEIPGEFSLSQIIPILLIQARASLGNRH